MKHILLLIFLLLPSFIQAQLKLEFEAEYKKGYLCINHLAKKGETINELSQSYFLRNEVLSNINNVNANATLKENQPILIPLLETNYFRMAGITAGKIGLYPIYYRCASIDSVQSICYKFMLQKSVFMKWNQLQYENQLKEGDKVLVGWLKYGTQQATSNSALSKSAGTQHMAGTGKTVASTNKATSNNITNSTIKNKSTTVVKKESSSVSSKPVVEKSTVPTEKEKRSNHVVKNNQPSIQPKTNQVTSSTKEVSTSGSTANEVNTKAHQNQDTPKKKKSIKEIWNQLVNGKADRDTKTNASKPATQSAQQNVVATKPASMQGKVTPATKTTTSIASQKPTGPVVKKIPPQVKLNNNTTQKVVSKTSSTTVTTTKPLSANTIKTEAVVQKTEPVQEKKIDPALATKSKLIEPKKEVLTETRPLKTNVEVKPIPTKSEVAATKKTNEIVAETKPVSNKTTVLAQKKTNDVPSTTIASKEPVTKDVVAKGAVKNEVAHNKTVSESTPEQTNSDATTEEVTVPKAIHSVTRNLNLTNSKSGKCSYFFSGPMTGQFYAFTNLAIKGDIVKVTNLQNNRSVMAEVIGVLPNSDLTKGLLIKLSDNAKLPLGQKNNSFNVKVNY